MYTYNLTQWLAFLIIYCFIGWCWESSFVSVKKKKIYVTGKKKGQTKIRVLVKFKKHSKLKAKKFVIKVNVQKKKQKSAAKTNVKTQTVNKKPVVTQKPATSGTGSTVNSGSSVDKKITRSEWVSVFYAKNWI